MAFKWTITDDYPRTLRGMASLIGEQNASAPKSGLEKRIELDIEGSFTITPSDLMPILEVVGCHLVDTMEEEDVRFFMCDHCLVVAAPTKIIFTADSAILIHNLWMPGLLF
eukprot:GDKK01031074.1.p1 GENE.GDKK01031074.1~~GDKK01031074.1.p1  ORF type:complete len:124 (-),score=20.82 GDKK01031074.1:88-420(-)